MRSASFFHKVMPMVIAGLPALSIVRAPVAAPGQPNPKRRIRSCPSFQTTLDLNSELMKKWLPLMEPFYLDRDKR